MNPCLAKFFPESVRTDSGKGFRQTPFRYAPIKKRLQQVSIAVLFLFAQAFRFLSRIRRFRSDLSPLAKISENIPFVVYSLASSEQLYPIEYNLQRVFNPPDSSFECQAANFAHRDLGEMRIYAKKSCHFFIVSRNISNFVL